MIREYGHDAEVTDLGSGYSMGDSGDSRRYRVALRMGPQASLEDYHRVKRAALAQLGRLVARGGERYDAGSIIEREYQVRGRVVREFAWARRAEAGASGGGVVNGRRGAGAAAGNAAGGAADVGGVGW